MESESSNNIEQENKGPCDLSYEFTTMDRGDFNNFVRTLNNVPELSISADWTNIQDANFLKAFLQTSPRGQKRLATIRATKAQKIEGVNAFSSGVEWIKIPS